MEENGRNTLNAIIEAIVNTAEAYANFRIGVKESLDGDTLLEIYRTETEYEYDRDGRGFHSQYDVAPYTIDKQRRIAAIKVTNTAELEEIAKANKHPFVRKAALGALPNESDTHRMPFLTALAKTDADPEVRRTAVQKMIDEAARIEIAKADADAGVRSAAVERIQAESALIV
ncbi:MAG: HEAT repeat domain-containing protein [Clostridiales bacterium]|nr:HEAT repeat domain-containing protein [Clostridiales bacterium]